MATYYVNVFTRGAYSGKPMAGAGSFNNFTIDGRLSLNSAIDIARHHAMKECEFKGRDYIGFAIKKSDRLDFTNATIVDCTTNNVKYL